MMHPKPTLVILAGGRSQRFGSNKALVQMAGKPCWMPLAELARRSAWNVLLSGPPDVLADFGFPVLPDAEEYAGPLVALAHILRNLQTPRIALVACDMPLVPFSLLQKMWDMPEDVVCLQKDGKSFPLPGIYSMKTLAHIETALAFGIKNLRAALSGTMMSLPEEQWQQNDPQTLSLWNMNTTQDFAELRSFYDACAT